MTKIASGKYLILHDGTIDGHVAAWVYKSHLNKKINDSNIFICDMVKTVPYKVFSTMCEGNVSRVAFIGDAAGCVSGGVLKYFCLDFPEVEFIAFSKCKHDFGGLNIDFNLVSNQSISMYLFNKFFADSEQVPTILSVVDSQFIDSKYTHVSVFVCRYLLELINNDSSVSSLARLLQTQIGLDGAVMTGMMIVKMAEGEANKIAEKATNFSACGVVGKFVTCEDGKANDVLQGLIKAGEKFAIVCEHNQDDAFFEKMITFKLMLSQGCPIDAMSIVKRSKFAVVLKSSKFYVEFKARAFDFLDDATQLNILRRVYDVKAL